MTKEEAINHIKYGIIENNYPLPKELGIEVFDMAIKALEQEPILNKIRTEIAQEYKNESEHPYGQGLKRAIKIIDKYRESEE